MTTAALVAITSVHEAGHAVVATILGWDYREVYVREDGSGCCVSTAAPPFRRAPAYDPIRLHQDAMISLGGWVAEELASRQPLDLGRLLAYVDAPEASPGSDAGHVAATVEWHPFRSAALDVTGRAVRELLTLHWSSVRALAEALADRRSLSGAEAAAIIHVSAPPAIRVRL